MKGTKQAQRMQGGRGRAREESGVCMLTFASGPLPEEVPPPPEWTSPSEWHLGPDQPRAAVDKSPLTLEHRAGPGTTSVTYSFQDHSGERKGLLGG